MALAKADSVDRWSEYQATRTKAHIAEAAKTTIATLSTTPAAQAAIAKLDSEIAKYRAEAPKLANEAERLGAAYDALNVHDDQFDASDALVSTAISLAAVAALAESFMLVIASWIFGSFGLFMGICGFAGWGFHPDVLSKFLG
jgi:hypothetical protein